METHLATCPACGNSLDVTEVGPFTRVSCPECSEELRVKTEMGPYTLRRRLGVGGMSLVFVAYDETLGREVALKVLNEDYSGDEERVRQFEQEARLMASVSHPNVVQVYTVGQAFGRFYIAMELVSGSSLDAQMEEKGALPESEVIPIALQVVDGLEAAAAAGLVHRDVKPGNILIDEEGTAKITDFGLSLLTEGGPVRTSEIWATPYYVPPETLEGEEEDHRSDIYALGSSLYHALSGRPPVESKDMSTKLLREQKRRVPSLHKVAAWLREETIEVIANAMAYHPRQRFADYGELRAALLKTQAAIEADGAVTPIHSTARAARRRRAREGRARIWVGLTAALVLTGVIVGVLHLRDRGGDPLRDGPAVSGVPVTLPPVDPNFTEAEAERISRAYAGAREALRRRDYGAAETAFAGVAADSGAPAQTAAWARFEAVVAAYLKGRPGDARRHLRDLERFLRESGEADSDLGRRLRVAIEVLNGLSFVPDERLPKRLEEPIRTTVFFAMALKMWEQGQLERARDHFIKLVESGPWENSEWVEIYREIAEGYLADFERLAAVEREVDLSDAEAIQAKHDELQELYVLLKTQGRARFNVRSWQADLLRARQLNKKAPAKWAETRVEALGHWSEGNFSKAREVLSEYSPHSEDGALQKAALLAIVESGVKVAERLARVREPLTMVNPVRDKEGGTFPVVRRGKDEGLVLRRGEEEVVRSWAELDAGSILEVYFAVVLSDGDPEVRAEALEAATAFALLGNVPGHAESLYQRIRDKPAPGGFGTWRDLRMLLNAAE